MEIIVIKVFEDLPHIVKAEDGKFYQLNYMDKLGRIRHFKELAQSQHNGSPYYRIDRKRYSVYKLNAIGKKCYKRVDLDKKVIKY